jgi:YihY family inner membrane protein
MKQLDNLLGHIDQFQQKHTFLSLPIAVIRRFGEDNAGHQAALITYYGFLSLFPLLLVAASIVGLLASGDHQLQNSITHGLNTYIPVIGDQLTRNIQASTKSGLALVVGLILTFYGARGGADAFYNAMTHVWRIKKTDKPGFPKSFIISVYMTLVGSLGLGTAAAMSAYAGGLGRSFVFKILSMLTGLIVLTPMFYYLLRVSIPRQYASVKDLRLMALLASIGIVVVQGMGSYLVVNQLHTLSPLYGTFALVLGLLFWIYLQATIVMYVVEFVIVRKQCLYPRSLSGKLQTAADKASEA